MKRIAFVAFALSMLCARQGLAQKDFMVELVGPNDTLPAVVCIASRTIEKPTLEWRGVSDVLGQSPDPCRRSVRSVDAGCGDGKSLSAPSSCTWRYRRCGGKGPAEAKAEDLANKLLREAPDVTVAFTDNGACAPKVVLPSTHKSMMCRRDGLARKDATGVAVLDIEFGTGNVRDIESFNVDGNLVTFQVAGKETRGTLNVRLAGGHYQETSVQPVAGQPVKLALEPVCYKRQLTWPAQEGWASNGKVVVKYRRGNKNKEWKSGRIRLSAGVVSVALPPSPSGEESTLTLVGLATYEVRWTAETPPIELPLRAKRVGFKWQIPCEFPYASECPVARLTDFGLESKGTFAAARPNGYCSYVVEGVKGTETFQLPADVVFVMHDLPT
ncbi:MAG: hypothetical protein PHU25_07050, partial [Deltaproteobacteria bacterium]|nr:hypothetical protein [Deltaproteobacteria bacterium]